MVKLRKTIEVDKMYKLPLLVQLIKTVKYSKMIQLDKCIN